MTAPDSIWVGEFAFSASAWARVLTPEAGRRNSRHDASRHDHRVIQGDGSVDHDADYMVKPRPGDLVMFPGWLTHHVMPTSGAARRISIAQNLGHDDGWEDTMRASRRVAVPEGHAADVEAREAARAKRLAARKKARRAAGKSNK